MAIAEQHINQWDLSSWLKKSEGSKGTVALNGALFAHSDPSHLYFMSNASGAGVRFDLHRSDIVDMADSDQNVVFGEQSFKGVRMTLKLDAVVVRLSVHLASALVEYPEHTISNIAGDRMNIKNTVVASVVMR